MNAILLKNLFASSNHMAICLTNGIFWMFVCSLSQAQAQSITPDPTMGTQVSVQEADYTISGGTLRGSNQFHSFGSFNYLSENPALMAEEYRSAAELLKEPCLMRMQGGMYSSLVLSGRDALPAGPGGLMPSPAFIK